MSFVRNVQMASSERFYAAITALRVLMQLAAVFPDPRV